MKDDYSESEELERDVSNVDDAVHVVTSNQHSDTDEDDDKVTEHDDTGTIIFSWWCDVLSCASHASLEMIEFYHWGRGYQHWYERSLS